jgi:choline dehydrogenase
MEDFEGGDDDLRGKGGPIRVTTVPENLELYRSFFEACRAVGIERTQDHNGHVQTGAGMTQVSMSRGRRMSTAATYLEEARYRDNLRIETGAQAQKLLIRDGRCVGVRIVQRGQVRDLFAGKEVIVSAGVIASPQLLELSGIGQPDRLRELGVQTVAELPGVGENLRDHWAPRMKWTLARRGQTFNELARGLGAVRQGISYLLMGKGFLTMPAAPLRVFVKTDERLEQPDSMFVLQPFLVTPDVKLSPTAGIQIVANQLRPESTGSVHAVSTDASVKPEIRFNFLSEQVDRDCLLYSMRLVRRVMAASALSWLEPEEFLPGAHAQTDDELLDFVARNAETGFHPVGTCKMGHDRTAVVDEKLQVHGIRGLRVADASIMPTMVSGNTNAPSIMIGEKAAQLVRATYG